VATEPTNSRHVLTLDEATDITMAFRLIPAGMFRMGSRGMGRINSWFNNEEPVHTVRITEPFWMAETPVTQAQFGVGKPDHENHFPGKPEHPAENLTWHEAGEFCQWLDGTEAIRSQFPPNIASADLPSETQWEYACRGPDDPEQGYWGHRCEYHTGDGEAALAEAGWFGEEWGEGSTHPVAHLKANGWGLFDLHGNVWEWCRDHWNASAYVHREDGIENPEVTETTSGSDSESRVLRGGSWGSSAGDCRSAVRYRFGAGDRGGNSGFRVCLFPGPVAE